MGARACPFTPRMMRKNEQLRRLALSRSILRLRSGFRLAAQTPPKRLKMSLFALDWLKKMLYPLPPASGEEENRVIGTSENHTLTTEDAEEHRGRESGDRDIGRSETQERTIAEIKPTPNWNDLGWGRSSLRQSGMGIGGGGEAILAIPYGCPTTTIDCGPVPAGAAAINTEVKLLAVIFAWNAATLFDPLLAT
jgi:hypothetical protein